MPRRGIPGHIECDPYQVTVFQLSGGTASIPKIIPRFSNEYLYNMQAFADWEYFDETTVTFMPLQVIHNAAMVCIVFPTLLRGGEAVVTASVDPFTVFSLIQQRKPTYFGVIGAALSRMQQVGARNLLPLEQVETGRIALRLVDAFYLPVGEYHMGEV